jgi:flavin reductase (DIM6/NTAB) family NADH-FMN oxidoreductase RutF
VTQRVQAGDHLLVIAAVTQVAYLAESGEPLIRFAGRYLASGPG